MRLDIINDGEQGRTDYTVHVLDRLTGFEGESAAADGHRRAGISRARRTAQAVRLAVPAPPGLLRPGGLEGLAGGAGRHRARQGGDERRQGGGIFLTSPSPGQIARYLKNKYYPSEEAYVYALADVMRREYKAIVEAGFMLQLDCPDLAMLRHMVYLDKSLADFRKIIAVNVAALNHAVRDLPPERMRMHVCWGSTVAPHHTDVELKDIIDIVLTARPQAVSFPGANARHEHEWKIWRDVKLPAGKIIIPGVIDSTVELRRASGTGRRPHRELRRVVGRDNVIAGVDCGFGTFAGRVQVDTKIVWMKLASLAEGARRAEAVVGKAASGRSQAPFLARGLAPYSARWRNPERSRKTRAKPTRAKAARPDTLITPARSPICSIRPSTRAPRAWVPAPANSRACSRRRIIRSTAAPIFPPPTRRANRAPEGFVEAPTS